MLFNLLRPWGLDCASLEFDPSLFRLYLQRSTQRCTKAGQTDSNALIPSVTNPVRSYWSVSSGGFCLCYCYPLPDLLHMSWV